MTYAILLLFYTFAMAAMFSAAHPIATDLSKRYLALTEEDLKAEHEKATPVSATVGKRVKRIH